MSRPTATTLLTDLAMIDHILEGSHERPVLLFKHSLTCPISSSAFHEFQRLVASPPEGDTVGFALIEIQNARPVSKAVADRTGVVHESPQAILLSKGKAVWNASHGSIREATLRSAIERVLAG